MKFVNGKPVPESDEKKIRVAVSTATSLEPSWINDFACWATQVKADEVTIDNLDGNNQKRYSASGTCLVNFRHKGKDEMHMPKKHRFSIVAEDTTDEWGLPDILVKSGSFTKED